jgi:hypothetical protein
MLSPQIECTVTVHRVDADPLRFKLQRTIDEPRNAGVAIENGLSANYLGVAMDGKLIMVPAHQMIEPAPYVLIAHVIKNVVKLTKKGKL